MKIPTNIKSCKLPHVITAAGILAALFLYASCKQPADTSSNSTPVPKIDPNVEWVETTLSKAKVNPTVIIGAGKKITLSGDDLTWTSNNTSIINVTNKLSGAYDVTPADGKSEVTLTAKAEKGSVSKTRDFTVIVHKDAATITAAELIKSINLPLETETDISLPKAIAGVSGSSITWGSEHPDLIDSDGKINMNKRDLRNQNVKLTATLTYNNTTEAKDFTVALKRLTKIEHTFHSSGEGPQIWSFTDSQIKFESLRNDKMDYGRVYAYTDINTVAKTFTAYQTHGTYQGRWYEIGSSEYKEALMKDVPPEEKNKYLAGYELFLKDAKTRRRYQYTLSYSTGDKRYWFNAEGVYDNSKKWCEQNGRYSSNGHESISIRCEVWGVSLNYNQKRYTGSLNAEGTQFTGKQTDNKGQPNGEAITARIVDNKDGTIEVTVDNQAYTLNFHGKLL